MTDGVDQVRNDPSIHDVYRRDVYEDEAYRNAEEFESESAPPPEEGKGQYVDIYV